MLLNNIKEYLTFSHVERLFSSKHSLKILRKSEHYLRRYIKNVSGCFFSEHSVQMTSMGYYSCSVLMSSSATSTAGVARCRTGVASTGVARPTHWQDV